MLPPVWNTLRAYPPVVDLVGLRIWRAGFAPQDEVRKAIEQGLAYVTWFVVDAFPGNSMEDRPRIDRNVVQIDLWCGGRDGEERIETLATHVRDAIEPTAQMTGRPIDGREPATRLWRMALQFSWFVHRPLFTAPA